MTGLHDVVTERFRIYTLDGKQTGTVTYPTIGSASPMFGRANSQNGFYSFESFIIPGTLYHYDVATGKTEIFAQPKVPFDSEKYEVQQVFYTSKGRHAHSNVHHFKKGIEA